MGRRFLNDVLRLVILTALLAATAAAEMEPDACKSVRSVVLRNFSDPEAQEVFQSLNQQREQFRIEGLESAYCFELLQNLADKASSQANGLLLSSTDFIQHAILYEGFRIETYLFSGVSPKRYFGFFDELGNTKEYETVLRTTIIDAVRITNDFAERSNLKSRISEKEIAITFLAEGGALLLTSPESSPNRVHPVREIGLDDFRTGFRRFPALIEEFDQFFGTKLEHLVLKIGKRSVLLRPMTFREAVLGTTVMYLFEKELTAARMKTQWEAELMSLPLNEQFIATSFVYNSGILFSKERVNDIKEFATGSYLAALNNDSKRPKLAVYTPEHSVKSLRESEPIPLQLTSWSAVYHILQRYGAWVAIERFSETFTNGAFRNRG